MKELKYLFSEAFKEVKNNPLESLGTLGVFAAMCVSCYLWMLVCYAIGG